MIYLIVFYVHNGLYSYPLYQKVVSIRYEYWCHPQHARNEINVCVNHHGVEKMISWCSHPTSVTVLHFVKRYIISKKYKITLHHNYGRYLHNINTVVITIVPTIIHANLNLLNTQHYKQRGVPACTYHPCNLQKYIICYDRYMHIIE